MTHSAHDMRRLITLCETTPTDTPAFRAWFANSKVVDAQGAPLRVYHGTGADISAFSTDNPRMRSGKLGYGIYTTPSTIAANLFARMRDKDGAQNVMPLYVKVENPFEIDGENNLPVTGIDRDKLIAHGYDGVILRKNGVIAEVVAYNPNQIKSAIGNSGAFASDDARLTK